MSTENTKLECIFHGEFQIAQRDPKTGLVDEKLPKVTRYRYSVVTKGSAREQYIADMEEITNDNECPMIKDANGDPTNVPAYYSKINRNRLVIERSVKTDGEFRGYFPIKDEIDEITKALKDDDLSEYEKVELGSANAKNRLADIRARVALRMKITNKVKDDNSGDKDDIKNEPENADLNDILGKN